MYCGRRQLHTKAESSLLYPVQVQERPRLMLNLHHWYVELAWPKLVNHLATHSM